MKTLDADAIMARATPVARQEAHEIQPFGHLVSDVIRQNEQQAWVLAEHVIDVPLVRA
jgi:hypothetical protein